MKKKKNTASETAHPVIQPQLQDQRMLRKQYKNQQVIIDQLCEIPVTLQTYEFLGELFFNYTFQELGHRTNSDEWISLLKKVRADIYQLFELARAARALKQEDS